MKPFDSYFAKIAQGFPKSRIAPAAFRSSGQLQLPVGARQVSQCSLVGSSSLTSFLKHVSKAVGYFLRQAARCGVGRADTVLIHMTPCPVQFSSVVTALSDCCRMSTSSPAKTSAALRLQVPI